MTQKMDGTAAAAKRKPHVPSWDVLRTAAFAAVAAQHILGAYARRPEIGLNEKLVIAVLFEPIRFAVPMFVFLFGAALFYVHTDRPRYLPYLGKRLRQLALPYVLWSVVYLFYTEKPVTLRTVVRSVLYGDADYHLWYVPMIFQFVLLMPLFFLVRDALRRRCGTRRRTALALVGLFAAWLVLLAWHPTGRIAQQLLVTWRTRIFVPWLGYFALGALCGLFTAAFTAWARRLLVLTGLLFVGSAGYAAYLSVRAVQNTGAVNFSCVSFLSPVYAVMTLAAILFLYGLAEWLAQVRPVRKMCGFVGRHSYQAYLAHVLVLTWCSLELLQAQPEINRYVFYAVLTVCTLVGAVLIAWGVDSAAAALRRCGRRISGQPASVK